MMFPDSKIASKLLLARTKLGYIVNYGLAPYFKEELSKSLSQECNSLATKFTSCFEESFNRISNKKQFHVHLIYFDETESIVKRCFIGSKYMGAASSAKLWVILRMFMAVWIMSTIWSKY